jgi:cytidyltransferase-like protein
MNVFVSGTFDLLHSGHVTFLKNASEYGGLHVGIGSDYSVKKYKGQSPVCNQDERLFMIRAIKYVKKAWVNSGEGPFDFAEDVLKYDIDTIIVNEEQHTQEKEDFCFRESIEYIILKRDTLYGLPQRSTTKLRELCK